MNPNGILTLAYAYDFVKAKLAAAYNEVELGFGDFRMACAEPALREYNAKKPFVGRAALTEAAAGSMKYGPIETRHPCFTGVARAEPVDERDLISGQVDPLDPWYQYRLRDEWTGQGDVVARAINYKGFAEVVDQDFQWHGQWEPDGHFYLYVRVPDGPSKLVGYTWHGRYLWEAPAPLPTQGALTTLQVPAEDMQWILDWCLAEAKQVVARARGKFVGIPDVEGSSEVDAVTLLEEYRAEMEALRESMRRRRRPLMPTTG
jgi:hypothetical protein